MSGLSFLLANAGNAAALSLMASPRADSADVARCRAIATPDDPECVRASGAPTGRPGADMPIVPVGHTWIGAPDPHLSTSGPNEKAAPSGAFIGAPAAQRASSVPPTDDGAADVAVVHEGWAHAPAVRQRIARFREMHGDAPVVVPDRTDTPSFADADWTLAAEERLPVHGGTVVLQAWQRRGVLVASIAVEGAPRLGTGSITTLRDRLDLLRTAIGGSSHTHSRKEPSR